jgi:hypothetical protein
MMELERKLWRLGRGGRVFVHLVAAAGLTRLPRP